jgi:superfamily II DNA or RNA helicase
METEIGHLGYSITLKSLPPHFLNEIKTDLTVKPLENPNFQTNEIAYPVYRISKTKIYLPRFYGLSKFGEPKVNKLKTGESINLEFKGTLRELQQETIDAVVKNNYCGLISLATGLGKTVVALKLVSLMKVKTMVVVHADFLLDQWKERIKQYLPDARIGVVKQDLCQIENTDIVIGMIQTIIKREYPKGTFDSIGMLQIDECFPYRQRIITSSGSMEIGTIYNLWNSKKQLPLVLSFNEEKQVFEYKKITYAWEKVNENLLKISYSKTNIKCTENHKILTLDGYKPAKELEVGDLIKCNFNEKLEESMVAKALNNDQYQVFLGSYLGDGNIHILPSQRYRLRIIHGEKQEEYCKWKSSMFDSIAKKIENNGYAKGVAYKFCTRIIDLPKEKQFTNNYKTCPQWVLDDLDYRGVAIWWMDDGSLSKNTRSGTLSTCSFDEETHIRFVEKFKKMGIVCKYKPDGHGYLSIYFNREGIESLLSKISIYLHENLKYKFINKFIDYTKNTLYDWNNKYLNYGTVKISKIESIKNKSTNAHVYDIEVEDNHNFICSTLNGGCGPIVHNCHHISSRTFSSLFYKVQPKYLIGLSATPERKDGLSKVLYWFMGPQIITIKRETGKPKIQFVVNDTEGYTEKFNRLGKVNIPEMITDLSIKKERNEMITVLIQDLLKQNRKILLLSERRDQCEYFNKQLKELQISTGLYLGGMKTVERETSILCSVIIGTYQAAGEGFDVATLDTLILATPKSDVEQAVGRILRQKNANEPLVLDIVDSFSIFKGQYYKRRKFYKKSEFKLI